jgi:hypothetical protein
MIKIIKIITIINFNSLNKNKLIQIQIHFKKQKI